MRVDNCLPRRSFCACSSRQRRFDVFLQLTGHGLNLKKPARSYKQPALSSIQRLPKFLVLEGFFWEYGSNWSEDHPSDQRVSALRLWRRRRPRRIPLQGPGRPAREAEPVDVLCFGDQDVGRGALTRPGRASPASVRPARTPSHAKLMDTLARNVHDVRDRWRSHDVVHCHTWYTHLAGCLLQQPVRRPPGPHHPQPGTPPPLEGGAARQRLPCLAPGWSAPPTRTPTAWWPCPSP